MRHKKMIKEATTIYDVERACMLHRFAENEEEVGSWILSLLMQGGEHKAME